MNPKLKLLKNLQHLYKLYHFSFKVQCKLLYHLNLNQLLLIHLNQFVFAQKYQRFLYLKFIKVWWFYIIKILLQNYLLRIVKLSPHSFHVHQKLQTYKYLVRLVLKNKNPYFSYWYLLEALHLSYMLKIKLIFKYFSSI